LETGYRDNGSDTKVVGITSAPAITALVYDAWTPGAWFPGLADRFAMIPPVSHGSAAALARLEDLHEQQPIDVLLPCLDLEVPLYGRLAGRLARLGIRTLLPRPDAVAAAAKGALPGFCFAHGIATPRTLLAADLGEAVRCAGLIGYPVMVKGTVADAQAAYSPDQVAVAAERLGAKWGGGVLIQEFVDGDEYVVAMLAGRDGACLGQVPMRKLGRNQMGKAIAGAVVVDDELTDTAGDILACLDWCGPLELEFVRDRRSGRYLLIEVNCRFPAWIYLGALAGVNLPQMLIAEAMGEAYKADDSTGRTDGTAPAAPTSQAPASAALSSSVPVSTAPAPARPGAAYVRVARDLMIPRADLETLRRRRSICPRPDAPAVAGASPQVGAAPRRGGLAVAVTGLNGSGPVMPGVGTAVALRAATEVGTIIGLAAGRYDTGVYRRDLYDYVFRVAFNDPGALCTRLAEIKATVGLDVVIPCLDADVTQFVDIADALARIGIATLLPDPIALAGCEKAFLFTTRASGRSNGSVGEDGDGTGDGGVAASDLDRDIGPHLFLPATRRVRDWEEAEAALEVIGLPAVLKGLRAGTGLVFEPRHARGVWAELHRQDPAGCLVQRYIGGEEFAIAGVIGPAGETAGTILIKKLLRCEGGKTWGATVLTMPTLVEEALAFMRALGWRGPFEIELMREVLTERFGVLEINPRLPSWIGYCAVAGDNLPRAVVRTALGLPRFASPTGGDADIYLRTCEDISVHVRDFAAFEAKGSLRHVD